MKRKCPVCGELVTVNDMGTLRMHPYPKDYPYKPTCQGSGVVVHERIRNRNRFTNDNGYKRAVTKDQEKEAQ